MKNMLKFALLAGCFAVIGLVSCNKEEATDLPQKEVTVVTPQNALDLTVMSPEEREAFNEKRALISPPAGKDRPAATRVPITYTELCEETISATHATAGDWPYGTPATWDYYCFSGDAGDEVSFYVRRTTPGMDPISLLFYGKTEDTDNIYNLPQVGGSDDTCDDPFGSCYGDPCFSLTLPYTGSYTLIVADFFSCGSPLTYEIITTGIVCDADGDGCNDDVDPHPNSNLEPTVTIGGCDSGVPNVFPEGCSTMSDLIGDCAAAATNHGEFVSCVAALTNAWKEAGLITGTQKGAIQSCAAQSGIGN